MNKMEQPEHFNNFISGCLIQRYNSPRKIHTYDHVGHVRTILVKNIL